MKRAHSHAVILAALLALAPSAPAFAQQREPPSTSKDPIRPDTIRPDLSRPREETTRRPDDERRDSERRQDEEVVRISTDLVQVDAVVMDEKGRHVTDLTAEDFEIYEAGKPQKITDFSRVVVQPDAPSQPPAATRASAAGGKSSGPAPPLVRTQTRRAFALVMDDICSEFSSVGAVRGVMRKFVDEQMRPGDIAAIILISGGNSVLQQFTADRNLLHRAIAKVRWYPTRTGTNCVGDFRPTRDDTTYKAARGEDVPLGQAAFEDAGSRASRERIGDRVTEVEARGVLGAVGVTLRGMRGVPGRKSLVLFSDRLPMVSSTGEITGAHEQARFVVDEANRAGVVIYAIDPRGVYNPAPLVAESAAAPRWADQIPLTERPTPNVSLNGASNLLAEGTGGLFLHTNNDLSGLMGRVLEDQSAYYLIGYRPSEESLRKGRDTFRDIRVKVRRPGLRVRARKGFFAPEIEDKRRAPARGTARELYEALAARIDKGEVEMRLTASFKDAPVVGPVVRTLLHVDGRGLTLTDEPNGWKKLVIDVAAATVSENGKVADEFTRTHTVRLDPEGARVVRENGLTYAADVPIKKPGAYQFRIVLRDTASQRVGSASQYLEAPDLARRDTLAVSGITLREASAAAAERARATAETALAAVTSPADPAVRRFRPGAILAYDYQIYHGQSARGGQPRVTTQTQLYRDGQLVFTSPEEPFELAAQGDATRLSDSRLFKLGDKAAPGAYALQILVHETDPRGKRRTTSQVVDFEVVN